MRTQPGFSLCPSGSQAADCDQGLGLPECGFLLSGLDGLVLAKV